MIETENDNDSEKKLAQTTSAAAILEDKKAEKRRRMTKSIIRRSFADFSKMGDVRKVMNANLITQGSAINLEPKVPKMKTIQKAVILSATSSTQMLAGIL